MRRVACCIALLGASLAAPAMAQSPTIAVFVLNEAGLSDRDLEDLQEGLEDVVRDYGDFDVRSRDEVDDDLSRQERDDLDECECQETDSLYGVILRLDMSAMPGSGSGPPPKADITPSDNPFSGDEITNMVFCYGLRNAYRFDIDPVTGDLVIGDVGEVNFEEMNIASYDDGGIHTPRWSIS